MVFSKKYCNIETFYNIRKIGINMKPNNNNHTRTQLQQPKTDFFKPSKKTTPAAAATPSEVDRITDGLLRNS